MSQRDVLAELRSARVEAPPELRARVRLAAAAAEPPRRRLTRRRALAVALPLAAALAGGIVALTRPSHEQSAVRSPDHGSAAVTLAPAQSAPAQSKGALTVPTPADRAQIYDETLSLQLKDGRAVSDGVKRALRIAASLHGYATSVHADTGGTQATADVVLKIPRAHVRAAMTRLSALGTIVAEHVDVEDAQAQLNAADRTIARLQRQLKTLRAQQPAPAARIAQLEARIAALQRSEAATRLRAHYATVSLHLETPAPAAPDHHGRSRLHGIVVALTWLGIGALYVLAIGGPLAVLVLLGWLAVRLVRRRRDEALLSRL